MKVEQRLMNVRLYLASFNNRQLAGELNHIVVQELGVEGRDVVMLQLDRAEYGLVAADTLLTIFYKACAGNCISHTLTHCGEHLHEPTSAKLLAAVLAYLKRSSPGRRAWGETIGPLLRTISDTRWWSYCEAAGELLAVLDPTEGESKFPSFLNLAAKSKAGSPQAGANLTKMVRLWNVAAPHRTAITFELAAMQDVCRPFVSSTYILEGDGPVSLVAYDLLMGLQGKMELQYPDMEFPNVRRLARKYALEGQAPPTAASQVKLTLDCFVRLAPPDICYINLFCIWT